MFLFGARDFNYATSFAGTPTRDKLHFGFKSLYSIHVNQWTVANYYKRNITCTNHRKANLFATHTDVEWDWNYSCFPVKRPQMLELKGSCLQWDKPEDFVQSNRLINSQDIFSTTFKLFMQPEQNS